MVILDCSMSGFARLKNMNLENVSKIYVLVTHTHGDHISGIGLLIDYEYIVGKIPVVVVTPNEEVRNDMEYFLTRMEGISEDWYSLVSVTELEVSWLRAAIPTTHVPNLAGRCFGYALRIDGRNVVYTGDTNTLDPFLPYLDQGSILYMEVSAYKTGVHLYAEDVKETVRELETKGVTVFLMHVDDEDAVSKIMEKSGAFLAPLLPPTISKEPTPEEASSENAQALKEVFDISEQLYQEMCSVKKNDHRMLFLYLTELGKALVGADRASFWKWDKRKHTLWTTSATGLEKIEMPDDAGFV